MTSVRVLLAATAAAAALSAHGLQLEWRPAGDAVVVRAWFDGDNQPASNADVSIYRAAEDEPYASGSTDPRGLFAFVPDAAGRWTAVVDDGFGHRETLDIAPSTEPEGAAREAPAAPAPTSRRRDLITGLAVIFGLTGFWAAMRRSTAG